MRNAIESSLPEVLINRTSYSLSGRLKFSTLGCRKAEKENISQGLLGTFDSNGLLSDAGVGRRSRKGAPLA